MTYLFVVSKTSEASSRYFCRNRSPGAVSSINLLKKSVSDTKNANPMATRKRPCFQLIGWSNGTEIRLPQATLNDAMLQPNKNAQLRCLIASIACSHLRHFYFAASVVFQSHNWWAHNINQLFDKFSQHQFAQEITREAYTAAENVLRAIRGCRPRNVGDERWRDFTYLDWYVV